MKQNKESIMEKKEESREDMPFILVGSLQAVLQGKVIGPIGA